MQQDSGYPIYRTGALPGNAWRDAQRYRCRSWGRRRARNLFYRISCSDSCWRLHQFDLKEQWQKRAAGSRSKEGIMGITRFLNFQVPSRGYGEIITLVRKFRKKMEYHSLLFSSLLLSCATFTGKPVFSELSGTTLPWIVTLCRSGGRVGLYPCLWCVFYGNYLQIRRQGYPQEERTVL